MILKIVPIFLILIFCGTGFTFNSWHNQLARGNKEFAKNSVSKAIEIYQQALVDAPEEPIIHYNLGYAHYRNQDYSKADEHFAKVQDLTKNEKLKNDTEYNLGNITYRSGEQNPAHSKDRWEEALQHYQKVIKANPTDEDAKYNYEFVKKKLAELKNQEKSNNEQNQNSQQQENQHNQNSENKENAGSKENNDKDNTANEHNQQQNTDRGDKEQSGQSSADQVDEQNLNNGSDSLTKELSEDQQSVVKEGMTKAQALQLLEQFAEETGDFMPIQPKDGSQLDHYKDW